MLFLHFYITSAVYVAFVNFLMNEYMSMYVVKLCTVISLLIGCIKSINCNLFAFCWWNLNRPKRMSIYRTGSGVVAGSIFPYISTCLKILVGKFFRKKKLQILGLEILTLGVKLKFLYLPRIIATSCRLQKDAA